MLFQSQKMHRPRLGTGRSNSIYPGTVDPLEYSEYGVHHTPSTRSTTILSTSTKHTLRTGIRR